MSLRRKLRKTPTDSSSSPFEEGPLGAAAKASFHNRFYLPLTHPFMRPSMYVDLQYYNCIHNNMFIATPLLLCTHAHTYCVKIYNLFVQYISHTFDSFITKR